MKLQYCAQQLITLPSVVINMPFTSNARIDEIHSFVGNVLGFCVSGDRDVFQMEE